jgi:GAF domain-containing protein
MPGGRIAGGPQAIQRGELPAFMETDAGQDSTQLNVPIRLRGQTIGVIQLRFDSPASRLQVESVAEEVGARLALLLESARLLEEAQHRAQREQQINVIATQMRSAVDLEGVLHNTVRELGKALGARRTYIQLGDYAVSDPTLDAVDTAGIDTPDAEAEA